MNRERDNGRYTFDGGHERLCTCGHRFGVHASERYAGEQPCFAGDDVDVCPDGCACTCFVPLFRKLSRAQQWALTSDTDAQLEAQSRTTLAALRRRGLVEEWTDCGVYGPLLPSAHPVNRWRHTKLGRELRRELLADIAARNAFAGVV